MEKEINDIITHNNTIQDPVLSEKLELLIQKQNSATIPSIIIEYLSPEEYSFELENLKQFFNHFGEVLNLIVLGKKIIVLFKTFFISFVCKEFFQNEKNFKENKKKDFTVRWFDFEKDENLLISNDIKPIFKEIYRKNAINLKQNSNDNKAKDNQNNNANNSLDIKMNMNMNINNININTTMNPMAQNQNMMGIPNMQYLQLLQLAKMNLNKTNNNIMPQGMGMMPNYNFNPMGQMQNPHQTPMNIPINMLMNRQNLNNNINNMNLINNMNNMNLNNNIKNQLMNQNFQQINNNPQFKNLQNNNYNQNINKSNNVHNNINDEKNFGKYTCKYEILIANDKDFQIARRLIGSKGSNMKKIINECKLNEDSEGIKLRLRGRGSGFKEGPENKESDEPLHLCISSKNEKEMKKACLLVDELLTKIHEDYKEYCQKNNVLPSCTEIATRIESKNTKGK